MSPLTKFMIFIVFVLLFEFFIFLLKSPITKGRLFEKRIADAMKTLSNHGVYGKVLTNIYLPKNEYETSEIDVLFLSTIGAFVIECKNYNGWIFGNEKADQWTVTLPSGKGKSKKYHFYNPVWQNYSHVKPLREYLNTIFPERQIRIFPIVCFSRRSTLKKISVSSQPVICENELYSLINNVVNNNGPILTRVQVDEIYEKMLRLTKVDNEVKRQHIENIKNKNSLVGQLVLI